MEELDGVEDLVEMDSVEMDLLNRETILDETKDSLNP
jgi:hypothetical protein